MNSSGRRDQPPCERPALYSDTFPGFEVTRFVFGWFCRFRRAARDGENRMKQSEVAIFASFHVRSAVLVYLLLMNGLLAQGSQQSIIEDVAPEDVKKFIDPTVMNDVLEYRFQANFLPQQARLYSHRPYIGYSLNYWSAVWAEVPFVDFSIPDSKAPSGIGDTLIGWGFVPYKDLTQKLTGAAFWMEALAPTGSAEKATGFGTWVLAPGGGIALNPTDRFPIYIWGRYLHSLRPLGGEMANSEEADLVRSIELNFETVQIFPKGFFVAALPSFTFDLNEDFNVFSLGAGVGRALNRRLLVTGGYVHYVAGERTFNQALVVGLSFIWGDEKVKPEVGKTLKSAAVGPTAGGGALPFE